MITRSSLKRNLSKNIESPQASMLHVDEAASVVGICTQIYPDYLLASIKSSFFSGERVFPYLPESGIRVGSTVRIESTANIPRITKTFHFGTDYDKTVVLDLDKEDTDKVVQKIYNLEAAPAVAGIPKTEKLAYSNVIVKHKGGEKVINVDLSGIKIGYQYASLFYGKASFVKAFKESIYLQSPEINIMTLAGTSSHEPPGEGEDIGLISSTMFKKEDEDTAFEFMYEFKGNIPQALSKHKIVIDGRTVPAYLLLRDSVYLFLILDDNLADYAVEGNVVTHTYRNRKLTISGGSGNKKAFNKAILEKIGGDSSFIKSKAIICKIEENSYPITYLKSIDRKGNIYEFNAGEKTSISYKEKDIVIDKKDIFALGRYSVNYQDDYNSRNYPAKENSTYFEERYGNYVLNSRGKVTEFYDQKRYSTLINTLTKYVLDKDSGIETKEHVISPHVIREHINAKEYYSDPEGTGDKVIASKIMKNGDGVSSMRIAPDETGFSANTEIKGKISGIAAGSNSANITTNGEMIIKSVSSMFLSRLNTFSGMVRFEKGINVEGNLNINAQSITFNAKENIYMEAKNIYSKSSTFGVSFSTSCQIVNTETVIKDKKTLLAAGIIIGKTNINIQGERSVLYAKSYVAAVSDLNAVFGGKTTNISGLKT